VPNSNLASINGTVEDKEVIGKEGNNCQQQLLVTEAVATRSFGATSAPNWPQGISQKVNCYLIYYYFHFFFKCFPFLHYFCPAPCSMAFPMAARGNWECNITIR